MLSVASQDARCITTDTNTTTTTTTQNPLSHPPHHAYYASLPYRPLPVHQLPQHQQQHRHPRPLPFAAQAPFMSISSSTSSTASAASSMGGGSSPPGHGTPAHHPTTSAGVAGGPAQDAAVAQALEIARESPDGAQDPTVSKILEQALSRTWAKVQAHPDAYIMTRNEFAVFNFFQHRFSGDRTAVGARKRYWDNMRA